MGVTDWPPLVGGGAGLRQLEGALAAPVHAYLLVGTVAGDKRAVARTFAGELLAAAALAGKVAADPEVAERHRRRARQATHPDVVLVEPEGRALLAAEATAIITEAARRPLEGAGKVIICDRFHTATPAVAASLLKTVEEPPPEVTIVLLADDVPSGHVTVASRCVTVRFPAPSPEEVQEWLVGSGVSPAVARRAARAVGSEPGRAGDLVAGGNLAERLDAWWSIPERLDGTGARVAAVVDGLWALIDAAAEAATEEAPGMTSDPAGPAHEDPDDREAGPTPPAARAERQRSDRRRRRVRDAELRFGFALLAERYGELLEAATDGSAGSRATGPAHPAESAAGALGLLREATAALVRNPDEKLLLQNLLLHLPRREPL
ncbi:MAG: hypothetical protein F4062_01090 [Acidimicrobiia bacterium]|nr:hypothetical protein [Acidimicrobiia bacterium]